MIQRADDRHTLGRSKVEWWLSVAERPDGRTALLLARVTYRGIDYQGMGATPEDALRHLLSSLGATAL